MTKRHFLIAAVLLLSISSAFAQGNGLSGINQATSMVTSYFDPATKLIYAIGAVVGLIGGVKVYSKFSSGDPDTSKTAASWFGACIFLIVAATILRSFFLYAYGELSHQQGDRSLGRVSGTQKPVSVHFRRRVACPFRAVCHPLYGGCQSMDLYRLRRDFRIHSGVADFLPEQEVWGTRADEAFRFAQPPSIPHQPTTHSPSAAAQGAAKTKEKRE